MPKLHPHNIVLLHLHRNGSRAQKICLRSAASLQVHGQLIAQDRGKDPTLMRRRAMFDEVNSLPRTQCQLALMQWNG
jgi:hypothetical protein